MFEQPDILFDPELILPFADGNVYPSVGIYDYDHHTDYDVLEHYNIYYEVHVVLSGSCQFDLNGETISLTAGDAVFIVPGCTHYPHDWSADFDRFTFRFTTDAPQVIRSYLQPVKDYAICALGPQTVTLCRDIYREIGMQDALKNEMLHAMFTQLLTVLFRSLQSAPRHASVQPKAVTPSRIALIDGFFFPWPFRFGTEKELADMLGLSSRQLHRVLMENYGMGFQQKMLHSRMMYAACMLRTTDKTAGEIGCTVGYADESSFYKAFKSYFQMTPQQYRSEKKK